MAMKLVKQTADYSIYQRRDQRYAVKDADSNAVNGDDKVRILVAEGLVSIPLPAEPVEETVEEEQPAATEAGETAVEEAPAEDAATEEDSVEALAEESSAEAAEEEEDK